MSATISHATRIAANAGTIRRSASRSMTAPGSNSSASPRGYSPVVLANMAAIGADQASPTSAAKAR